MIGRPLCPSHSGRQRDWYATKQLGEGLFFFDRRVDQSHDRRMPTKSRSTARVPTDPGDARALGQRLRMFERTNGWIRMTWGPS